MDEKQLQRVTAQLRADHRPRQLGHEPRLSRVDEQNNADVVARDAGEALRISLRTALATITLELEYVKPRLGRCAPGDNRGYLREIEHGIEGLRRALAAPD